MSGSAGAARVLLADIGGTNARFALADPDAASPLLMDTVREYPVTAFASLPDAARHHLDQTGDGDAGAAIRRGVFAVAGRVEGDEARITNHPWVISRQRTQAALGFDALQLVNDFTAQSMAISLLQPADMVAIGGAVWSPPPGRDATYAVLGPGTGLGVGGLLVRNGAAFALQSEGGHTSFAPGTPEEIRILQQLSTQFGRVSNERLVCGPGLVNLHRALSEIAGLDPGPMQPADVTRLAREGDVRSARAVDIFCAVFGAIAGDLVLTIGAWDGVFLAGGLVPRILGELQHSGFRQRFENKGRFSANMARVPSMAVVHPQPGLLGGAAIARQWAGSEAAARAAGTAASAAPAATAARR